MYNRAKRILGLIAGISTIAIGGLACLGGLLSLALIELMGGSALFFSIPAIGLAIPLCILGAKACKKPAQVDGVWVSDKKIRIASIVLLGVLFVFEIIVSAIFLEAAETMAEMVSFADLFSSVATSAIEPIALHIVTLCLKTEVKAAPAPVYTDYDGPNATVAEEPVFEEFEPARPAPQSGERLEEKIKQLKEWKEQGIISEEQYERAVQKLMDEYVK